MSAAEGQQAAARPPWWHGQPRKAWRYLTGFHTLRSWHVNAYRDARRLSDRTVFLLWLCSAVALTAWWRTMQASGGDLAAAGFVFVAVLVGSWYVWNILSTVRRDRRRLIARLRVKATASLRKPELLQPQRGEVRVGRAQGLHRGVIWEKYTAYPEVIRSTYPPTLLNDGDPSDRERVEAVFRAELEGLDERTNKTWRRYGFTWQPSASQFTTTREDRVPDRLSASDETLISETGAVLGVTGRGRAEWHFTEHMYVQGITNGGKSTFMRHLGISIIRSGLAPAGVLFLDGKQSDDFGGLDGREGVLGVADTPDQWGPAFDMIESIVEMRYQSAREAARSHGQIPKPAFDRLVVIMDECQNFVARFGDQWENIARVARAANVWLVAGTQRGDIRSAFPSGATRDQYGALVHLGRAKQAGAEMMFGKGSVLVERATNLDPIRGRFLAVLDGEVWEGQTPHMPTDNDPEHPWAAALYPPLRGAGAGDDGAGPSLGPQLDESDDDPAGGQVSAEVSLDEMAAELDPEEVDEILEREERRMAELVEALENADDETDVEAIGREIDMIREAFARAGIELDDSGQEQDDNDTSSGPAPAAPEQPAKPEKPQPNRGSRVEEDY